MAVMLKRENLKGSTSNIRIAMRFRVKKLGGFSLIELVVALSISAAVITASTALLTRSNNKILALINQKQADEIAKHCYQFLRTVLINAGYNANIATTNSLEIIEDGIYPIAGSLFDLRYPIEINVGESFKPSNTAMDFNYAADSNALVLRSANDPILLTKGDSHWYGQELDLPSGGVMLLAGAEKSYLIGVLSSNNTVLTTSSSIDARRDDRYLAHSINATRLYINQNSDEEYALWQQRQQSSNPRKTRNSQVIEHVRYFWVQAGYGSDPTHWQSEIKEYYSLVALRIGIIVSLPHRGLPSNHIKKGSITLLGKTIQIPKDRDYFAYEWNFPIAGYDLSG